MKFMRRKEVQEVTGLPTATLYEAMDKGTFPKPIKLAKRSVGWIESEITAWMKARIEATRGPSA